jgi:hypothetical protein
MKRILSSALMLAFVSAPAFAAKNSETLNIAEPVMVGTTQLPAADYKVTWTGTGTSGQVTLTHGKTTVTVPAKVVEQKNNMNSILTDSKGGANSLEEIYLNKVSLILENAPHTGQ